MTWGIPSHLFLQIHVALSLIAMVAGVVVLYGLLTNKAFPGWTALLLLTLILTSVTGYPIAPFGFDPPRIVGTISLVLLAIAVAALYLFHLGGAWRWIYVVAAVMALYLDFFVGSSNPLKRSRRSRRWRRPNPNRPSSWRRSWCLPPSS